MKNYRVSYINKLDGSRRVLIGNISKSTAESVFAKVSDKSSPHFYMGKGVQVEQDDGTPDGAIIKQAA